jgi:hypothetical protein
MLMLSPLQYGVLQLLRNIEIREAVLLQPKGGSHSPGGPPF